MDIEVVSARRLTIRDNARGVASREGERLPEDGAQPDMTLAAML